MENLEKLLTAYNNAPAIYQATSYWQGNEARIVKEIEHADMHKIREGDNPVFAKFGFNESIYRYNKMPFFRKMLLKTIRKRFNTLPYGMKLSDIREMAFKHCIDYGKLTNARPITDIEVSSYGDPQDLFQIDGRKYTMQFLMYYLRYCFAHKHINFKGDEVVVELGSGSGHQVEVLKKLYPDMTIFCFDLPVQLFICSEYLKKALGKDTVIGSDYTLELQSLNELPKGKVYLLGNWEFPLLKEYSFNVFWNAASFGEMEPDVVKNYLSSVLQNCGWIYLLQARKGKEMAVNGRKEGVTKPITFDDYNQMLPSYHLVEQQDAYRAYKRMSESGGYFEAVWQKVNSQ